MNKEELVELLKSEYYSGDYEGHAELVADQILAPADPACGKVLGSDE